ncbi:hypothetical protein B0H21DRAFT_78021 [Amylocystis lapponica]|nr:hypothetical protein B0H21DRAFT_78021 [Amylocystis lapponica]
MDSAVCLSTACETRVLALVCLLRYINAEFIIIIRHARRKSRVHAGSLWILKSLSIDHKRPSSRGVPCCAHVLHAGTGTGTKLV